PFRQAASCVAPKVATSGKAGAVTNQVSLSSGVNASSYHIPKSPHLRPRSFLIFSTSLVPSSLPPPCTGNCDTLPLRRTVTCPLPPLCVSKVQPCLASHRLSSFAFIQIAY